MAKTPLTIVIQGIRTILLANGFSKFLLLAIEFMIAFALGASFFGLYAVVNALTMVVVAIGVFGINFGVIQYLSVYQSDRDQAGQQQIVTLATFFLTLSGLIMGLGVYMARDILAYQVFDKPSLSPLFAIAAVIIPIEILNYGLGSVFRGIRQFATAMLVTDLCRNVIMAVGVCVLLIVGHFDLATILWVYGAGSVVGLSVAVLCLKRQNLWRLGSVLDMTVFKDLLTFSYPMFVFNLLQVFSSRLLILGAGVFLTSADTGVLGVLIRLTLFVIFFQTAVGATVQSEFSRYQHKDDIQGQRDLFQNITRGLLCVCGAVTVLFLGAPDYLLHFIGDDYTGYGWMLWPIFLATLFNVVTGPAGQILVANYKQPILLKLAMFDAVLTCAVVLPFMAYFGLIGAVMGEAVRLVLFVAVRLWVTHRVLNIQPFTPSYLMIAGIMVLGLAVSVGINVLGIMPEYMAVAFGLVVYAGGLATLICKSPDMQAQLKTALSFRHAGQN